MSGESMSFDEYCKKNQHSGNCTRLEAFSMGQKSRQAEIDKLKKRIDEALRFYNEAKSPHNIGMIQMAILLKGKEND